MEAESSPAGSTCRNQVLLSCPHSKGGVFYLQFALSLAGAQTGQVVPFMNPNVCICCGGLMTEKGRALSRNPNLCASCSGLLDGMDDDTPLPFTSDSEEFPSLREFCCAKSAWSNIPTAIAFWRF
jgi:hypothetical protein